MDEFLGHVTEVFRNRAPILGDDGPNTGVLWLFDHGIGEGAAVKGAAREVVF